MPITTAFDVIAKSVKASAEQAKKITAPVVTSAPSIPVAPVAKVSEPAPVIITQAMKEASINASLRSGDLIGALQKMGAGTTVTVTPAPTEPSSGRISLDTVATPIVTTPAPAAPTETRKVISTDIMGNRTFSTYQITSPTGEVTYSVYEGGKPVSGLDNLTSGSGISTKIGKMVYGSSYGEPSATTVTQPTDVNLVTYFDDTNRPPPVTGANLSTAGGKTYVPSIISDKIKAAAEKQTDLLVDTLPSARSGTTATPEQLGATPVIPGEKPTDIQKEFIGKTEEARDPEAPYKANYYAGKDESGEPIYLHESPYQIAHDYNPATQDISQQQLYAQLETEFGSNLDVTSKNIEMATEAGKNIPKAEEYLSQLNVAITDVSKAGKYDDIFLVEGGVEVRYSKQEALSKLGSQLGVSRDYLDWKHGRNPTFNRELTAAEYLDWSKTVSEKLPEYETELKTVSDQRLLISKYKELGYKVNVKDGEYSFELPTATEVYKYKHGEWTPAALAAANLMESPLGIKSFGAMVQEVYTGDEAADTKVREARMEELSEFALGLDVAIKEGDYISHVVTSPAMVEGVYLPLATLGATSLISKGLNVAAPRVVAGLETVGSKFAPRGQAILGKVTALGKTAAEPVVTVGKAVVKVGSKLPSTELTRTVSGQALNWGAFGVMEGGKLVEVAVEEPEKFGGVLAESAFTWGLVTGAMGEGMKSLDIKMPEFKSTPAMAEFKQAGSARIEVFARKFDYNIAAPVKDVLGDVKYAVKSKLPVQEIKTGLADIKVVARREIYSTIPIQETRADIRAVRAKLTDVGEKVSGKLEAPVIKAREAVSGFKADVKTTFYEKVPLTKDVKAKVESFKFKEAEPPTTEFVPRAVKTKQTTVEPFGKQYKVIETKPKVFEVTEKPTKVIKYPAEGKNLEGTRPFGEKIEFKSKTIAEKPKRISHEPSEAKVESWRDLGRLTTKEKPVVKQDVLYPVPKREVLKMDVDVGARTAKLKPSKIGEVEFKAPENRPRTIEEVNERMRLRQEAEIKRGIKQKPTKATKLPDEWTSAGKRPSYLLEVKKGNVEVRRLEDVGKDITKKGETPLKFSKEDVAKLKGEKVTGEDTGLLLKEKPKVEIKAKPYESVVLKEAEEPVAKAGFDTSYLYRTVPAKYLVDIEQGIGGSSDYWTGRKPEVDREFGRNIRVGVAPVVITEPKIGTELDVERISPEITEEEGEKRTDIFKVGITELGGGTKLEQRLGLEMGSVLEQQLEQKLLLESRTILDVSPTTGRLPGKPFIPKIIKFGKREGDKEEEMLFGKKKKKKAVSRTRPGRKDILSDIVSVMRSQARYGKATHPKMSKKVYEEASRTGFRHVPTLELKTKQYTPRVKNKGLRLDSNSLLKGNKEIKINVRRRNRNVIKKQKWI